MLRQTGDLSEASYASEPLILDTQMNFIRLEDGQGYLHEDRVNASMPLILLTEVVKYNTAFQVFTKSLHVTWNTCNMLHVIVCPVLRSCQNVERLFYGGW